jgi:hypothetical protein
MKATGDLSEAGHEKVADGLTWFESESSNIAMGRVRLIIASDRSSNLNRFILYDLFLDVDVMFHHEKA